MSIPPRSAVTVTVATLNLFNNPHSRWPEREPLVHAQARALDADVYLLQEVDAASTQIARMTEALGTGYTAVTLANPTEGSIKSLAVITRLAVLDEDHCVDLGHADIALRVRLGLPARGDEIDVRPLDAVTTHLHFGPSRRGSEIRASQARRLQQWIGTPAGPLLVGGDFNASPTGAAVETMTETLRSAFSAANGVEPAWTHPTPLVRAIDTQAAFAVPVLPAHKGRTIDYLFVSRHIDVLAARTAFDRPDFKEPDLFPSDHLGLVATLGLS